VVITDDGYPPAMTEAKRAARAAAVARLVELVGAEVDQVAFDYAVSLLLRARDGVTHWLRIEGPMAVAVGGRNAEVEPGAVDVPATLLIEVLHRSVLDIRLSEEEVVALTFDNGHVWSIAPGDQYEGWTLSASNQALPVALPGGGFSAWGPSQDADET
jgi:hypothetical protein